MSVNSHIRNNGGLTRQLAEQGMSFRETAHSGTDPDELSEILSTPNSPIKVAAEGNMPIAYRCNFVSVGEEVTVADCTYEGTILIRREAPSDRMIVFMPMEGNASFEGMREQIYSVPARGTILEAGRAAGARLFGPRRHFGLFVDQAKIVSHLTHMFERTISGDIDFHPHIDLTNGPGLVLQQIVSSLHRGLSGDGPLQRAPLAVSSLCDAAIYLLLESCPNRYSNELALPAPAPAPRHVKWAIDFMQEHIAEPISLSDIAMAAKVSVRTLQQGFRQFRNTTPMSYLQDLRMAAAHRDLLESDARQAIADVALKWGFMHPGRFAAEYRKRFGQLPSQTLKR
ncbi:AraC family transcriptional regulator [Rhizobium laguerreae]|uniref:helix-turn-helix transcriptional regulator n=1 Tax=Rhizobium laguerreae TaxID=1076926 RepID=UPI001441C531|nr:AraC family transcriptional regulator [Rhizobium laguerreae]MBY3108044.1 AraC family transcriptional regulator [Rhizobium laguerreae]MBY3125576.1 AraC family transcriptional regulator [Rhizobium laguerreae]MBY3205081.1 AraC family transcriptional regulator [Rhizobium laguerreae]MBY3243138.1 AraC family transcriptional regulator [Rhizobium laguerreae]MBY3306603.1 AraC family transcriptional regulator [Rhizobium laguerreae]